MQRKGNLRYREIETRLNGHKATITEDYQRLKGIVMEKRSEEKLDKWIKDKQNIPMCVLMRSGRNVISNIQVG